MEKFGLRNQSGGRHWYGFFQFLSGMGLIVPSFRRSIHVAKAFSRDRAVEIRQHYGRSRSVDSGHRFRIGPSGETQGRVRAGDR
jgi:hypothetical protein